MPEKSVKRSINLLEIQKHIMEYLSIQYQKYQKGKPVEEITDSYY